jgi:hypothetical protein
MVAMGKVASSGSMKCNEEEVEEAVLGISNRGGVPPFENVQWRRSVKSWVG